ncbi:hypothetical protein FO675_04620 [Riemerella anatipestifer]|nr:hypothetical protein [Riemerella anatipestifer]
MSKAPNGKSLELRTNANDENGKAANRGRLYFVKVLFKTHINNLKNDFYHIKIFVFEKNIYIRSVLNK